MKHYKYLICLFFIILFGAESQAEGLGEEINYESIWQLSNEENLIRTIKLATKKIGEELGTKVYFTFAKIVDDGIRLNIHASENGPEVGYMMFYLEHMLTYINNDEIGSLRQDIIKHCGLVPKISYLSQITINDPYKGQGYSTIVMKIFNTLMDRANVCCIYLAVVSKMPFTAKLYAKLGYGFTPNTLKRIGIWAERNHDIKNLPENSESAVNEFLKDSTKELEYGAPIMIRFKKDSVR